jgi:ferrous iron transport protein A
MDKTCDVPECTHTGPAATCPLNRLGVGCRACVVSVSGDANLRRRLLEMGFCNGAEVEVLRRAPLGDPIEFRLRGYCLSLRDEQAQLVQVKAN